MVRGMIRRQLAPVLGSMAEQYPVVTVTGPRQSGKTTLVRSVFDGHGYCNLENPETRRLALEDPKQFFALHPPPLILDEVQRAPELLSWIQVRVDESQESGAYVLTGSHQFQLHEAITQSLAGRTALLRLLPFSIRELLDAGLAGDKNELLYRGFLPRIYDRKMDPGQAYANYFRTYVERDVRQLLEIRNVGAFENFIRLLAGRVGQPVNLSSLGSDTGVSGTTLKEWLSVLEASYIVFRLQPYYRNFGKRLVKSPKLYFVEPGLACWLLGIDSPAMAARDPLHGNLFENLIVAEALKARIHQGGEPRLYYWRDSGGNEVDLLYDKRPRLIPVEIKSAMTWQPEFTKRIEEFQRLVPDAGKGYVVYAGDVAPRNERVEAVPFAGASALFG